MKVSIPSKSIAIDVPQKKKDVKTLKPSTVYNDVRIKLKASNPEIKLKGNPVLDGDKWKGSATDGTNTFDWFAE